MSLNQDSWDRWAQSWQLQDDGGCSKIARVSDPKVSGAIFWLEVWPDVARKYIFWSIIRYFGKICELKLGLVKFRTKPVLKHPSYNMPYEPVVSDTKLIPHVERFGSTFIQVIKKLIWLKQPHQYSGLELLESLNNCSETLKRLDSHKNTFITGKKA